MSKISRRQLDQFYDQFYEPLIRYARRFVVSQESAEDLAQEAFVRLFQHPPENVELVQPWLRTVVQRLAFDEYRRMLQFQHHAGKWYKDDHHEIALSAEEETFRIAAADQVNKVLRKLSEREQRILLLRYSGHSYREIAEMLQLDQPQVGMMILRAMKKFQEQWNKEEMWNERQDKHDAL